MTPEPTFTSPIRDQLEELHREFSQIHDGDVTTYIPELGKADDVSHEGLVHQLCNTWFAMR